MEKKVRPWLKDEFGFLKGNFLVLVVSYVLSGFASGLNTPFRSPYIEGLGATVVEIGIISSVGALISAVIAIPGAYVADRYGRRNVIVVFTYFVAVGYLIHVFAPSWWFILLGTIVLNLSRVYLPALQAIEADSLPEEKRGMGYSLINMAPSIFSAISPPIAGIIVSRYELIPGMRLIYLATSLIILAIALLRTFFLKETLHTQPLELTSMTSHLQDTVTSFKMAVKDMNHDLWSFTLLELIYSFKDPIFFLYISLFVLQEVGITNIEWGYINSFFLPISLLLSLPAGKLVDKADRRTSVAIGYLLSIPVGIILVYSSGFNLVAVAFILSFMSQTLTFPAIHALRADLIPTDKRGRIIGLISVMKSLVQVPSAILFGWMYQSVSPNSVFLSAVILELCSLGVILSSFKALKRTTP